MAAAPANADGVIRVSVTGNVLADSGGMTLGALTTAYDITPNAEITVNWNLEWSAENKNLWEEGVKFTVPASFTQMRWQRDSYFTDYPAGHIGEPSGICHADDISFRASKRNLHWLTLTDSAGTGLVLLPVADVPLIARADSGTPAGTTLFASREVAGPRDFSGSWVAAHDIKARKGNTLSGAFMLRAVVP